ncbi:MAG TPA: TonB family protein [Acidobacteriota bacterium]|nr:TonB family protein [Acidobacteriota bacterium]
MSLISLVVALAFFATPAQRGTEGPASLLEPAALQLLTQKVPPAYPAQAEEARLEGTVRLKILVTTKGVVDRVEVVSGHPLLVQAAIDAVKQWQFKPYIDYARPRPFVTELRIPFTLDIPEAERELWEEFKRLAGEGKKALARSDNAGAEESLSQAVALGERLPDNYYLDFTAALRALGETYRRQQKYERAQAQYQRELRILQKNLEPDAIEIGSALVNLAIVYELSGRAKEAEAHYRDGADILEQHAAQTRDPKFKRRYQETLLQIWNQLGTLYIGQQRRQEAREILTKALELAKAIGAQEYVSMIEQNLAKLRSPRY